MVFQGRVIHSFAVLRQCRNLSLRRRFVTSAQKRALNEEQIAGAVSKRTEPSAGSGSSITQGQKLAGIPLALAMSGLTIYFLDQRDMLNGIRQSLGFSKASEVTVSKDDEVQELPKQPPEVVAGTEATPAAPIVVPTELISATEETPEASIAMQQSSTIEVEPERGVSVERMATVGFATSIVNPGGGGEQFAESIVHPEFGNRVTMELFQVSPKPSASDSETSQQSLKEELGTTSISTPVSSIINPDEKFEGLSVKELRDRLTALSLELIHRSNWEGIRMAQFRQTLEQELVHKNMEELHKQRLAFEELMSKKIREVEDTTERRAKALLAEKEQEVEQLLEAAKFTLTQEHEAELQAELDNWNREFSASLQKEVAKQVAEVKENHAKELAEKVAIMDEIAQKLEYLEKFAEMSRSYEQASRNAHKISAAALALTTKLESTGKNSVAEITALRKAVKAEEDTASGTSGISVALDQLPQDVCDGSRVPTVSELQANFNLVKRRARAASKVPEGKRGLGAQLFSYAFSAITVEPDPEKAYGSTDSVPSTPEGLSDSQQYDPDLILARAGKFVQLGDLETAIAELNKLKGQAAFTVKDWKQDATNRVMVNRMLKVIKLECALLNESLSE